MKILSPGYLTYCVYYQIIVFSLGSSYEDDDYINEHFQDIILSYTLTDIEYLDALLSHSIQKHLGPLTNKIFLYQKMSEELNLEYIIPNIIYINSMEKQVISGS